MLEIKISKCTLVLPEQDLINCLSARPEIFQNAIKRGKGFSRTQAAMQRQYKADAKGFDRWQLYEILKGNIPVNDTILHHVENMPAEELLEGVIETITAMQRFGR